MCIYIHICIYINLIPSISDQVMKKYNTICLHAHPRMYQYIGTHEYKKDSLDGNINPVPSI